MAKNRNSTIWSFDYEIPKNYSVKDRKRIEDAVREYRSRLFGTPEEPFHVTDFYGIVEVSQADAFSVISTAMMYGYMVGYHKGQTSQQEPHKNR